MKPFIYRRADESFVTELAERALAHESAILLGAPYSGKTWVLKKLRKNLKDRGFDVDFVEMLNETPIFEMAGLPPTLKKIVDAGPGELRHSSFLLAGSFSALVPHLAHQVLRRIQELESRSTDIPAEDARLVAVLTGEGELFQLLEGPVPPFKSAEYYMVQGPSRSAFQEMVGDIAADSGVGFADKDAAADELWELTGGNWSLLRGFLQGASTRLDGPYRGHITVQQLRDHADWQIERGVRGVAFLRRMVDFIAGAPDGWEDLATLIQNGTLPVGIASSPSLRLLEFAGVAVRDGDNLRCLSPFLLRLLKSYYNDRQWGDLYALAGKWGDAVSYYRRAPSESKPRPTSNLDRATVSAILNTLSAEMHAAAASGPDLVRQRLAEGIHLVLGFPEFSVWRWQTYGWRCLLEESTPKEDSHLKIIAQLLPPKDRLTLGESPHSNWPVNADPSEELRDAPLLSGLQPRSSPGSGADYAADYAMVWIVEDVHEESRMAIVASHAGRRVYINDDRLQALRSLFLHFVQAHEHAVYRVRAVDRVKMHWGRGNVLGETLGGLLKPMPKTGNLGDPPGKTVDHPPTTGEFLDPPGKYLLSIGCSRVLFCFRDKKRKHVRCHHESLDPGGDRVGQLIDGAWENSLLEKVAKSGQSRLIPNARSHPDLTPELMDFVRAANVRSLALIPVSAEVRDQPGKSILGVLLIERRDGRLPSASEVRELEQLARQLANALLIRDAYSLLHACLEQDDDPMLILDEEFRILAASAAAHSRFELPGKFPWPGWLTSNKNKWLDSYLEGPNPEESKRPQPMWHWKNVKEFTEEGGQKRQLEVICEWLKLPSGTASGMVVHLRDRNIDSVEAFSGFTQANSLEGAYEALLAAAKILGFASGQLYLIAESKPDTLIFERCFGKNKGFAQIELPLADNDELGTWLALQHETPLVFHYLSQEENLRPLDTYLGLPYLNISKSRLAEQIKKEEGSFWVDVPLIAEAPRGPDVAWVRGKPLGKLTLDCNEHLPPYRLDVLKALSSLYSALLDGIRQRAEAAEIRDREIERQALEQALRDVAHNINGNLFAYRSLHKRYAKLEAAVSQLPNPGDAVEFKRCNKVLSDTTAHVTQLVGRINDTFRPFQIEAENFDLARVLEERFQNIDIEGIQAKLICRDGSFPVYADRTLLLAAVDEMLTNSREISRPDEPAIVEVELTCIQTAGGDTAQIVYRDKGPGVPETLKKLIFNRFYSYRPPGAQKRGTGLGLNFLSRVIEAHHGSVEETGTPGEGVEFVIKIPKDCPAP